MNSDLKEVYQSQLNHYYQRKTNYKKQLSNDIAIQVAMFYCNICFYFTQYCHIQSFWHWLLA